MTAFDISGGTVFRVLGGDATWSAQRDPTDAYGIGVFDVDPGLEPVTPSSP